MPVSAVPGPPLHPLHALLLAFPIALFSTALAADITYLNSAEMQWSNFASWAIVGALVFGAPALLWAALGWLRRRRLARAWVYPAALAGMWLAGLVNAFQHSRDAWSSVGPQGLLLSLVATVLALFAGWIAYGRRNAGEFAR